MSQLMLPTDVIAAPPKPEPAYVVEVKTGVIDASGQGQRWWLLYENRALKTGRLRETASGAIVGGTVEVACDDREHAEWLAKHMVAHGGIPKTAVRVKTAAGGAS